MDSESKLWKEDPLRDINPGKDDIKTFSFIQLLMLQRGREGGIFKFAKVLLTKSIDPHLALRPCTTLKRSLQTASGGFAASRRLQIPFCL